MNCCAVYTARERLNGIQEAVSSILSSSTRFFTPPIIGRWSGVFGVFGAYKTELSYMFVPSGSANSLLETGESS